MGTAVMAGGEAAPLLAAVAQAFNAMALRREIGCLRLARVGMQGMMARLALWQSAKGIWKERAEAMIQEHETIRSESDCARQHS